MVAALVRRRWWVPVLIALAIGLGRYFAHLEQSKEDAEKSSKLESILSGVDLDGLFPSATTGDTTKHK